jgi:hypothetical protein
METESSIPVTIMILSNLATVDELALAHMLEQIVFSHIK